MILHCLILRYEGVVVQCQFLHSSNNLIYGTLRPLSRKTRPHFTCAFCICHVFDWLAPSNPDTIGSKGTSTNDSSIVIGINLIGRYVRWFRKPLNGLNRTVTDRDGGIPSHERRLYYSKRLCIPKNLWNLHQSHCFYCLLRWISRTYHEHGYTSQWLPRFAHLLGSSWRKNPRTTNKTKFVIKSWGCVRLVIHDTKYWRLYPVVPKYSYLDQLCPCYQTEYVATLWMKRCNSFCW